MGRPKFSLPFGSVTMLERVVELLRTVVSPVAVVAAAGQQLPTLPSDVLTANDETDDPGPLGGLCVGLSLLRPRVQAAYVTACDAPLLRPEFVRRMIGSLGAHELAIPRDGEHYQPLAAVYRTSLEDNVRNLIAQNRMRPFFLVKQSDANVIDVDDLRDIDPELDSLRNTNTPEEYTRALRDAGFDTPIDS